MKAFYLKLLSFLFARFWWHVFLGTVGGHWQYHNIHRLGLSKVPGRSTNRWRSSHGNRVDGHVWRFETRNQQPNSNASNEGACDVFLFQFLFLLADPESLSLQAEYLIIWWNLVDLSIGLVQQIVGCCQALGQITCQDTEWLTRSYTLSCWTKPSARPEEPGGTSSAGKDSLGLGVAAGGGVAAAGTLAGAAGGLVPGSYSSSSSSCS